MNLRWSLDAAYDSTRYKHLIASRSGTHSERVETDRPAKGEDVHARRGRARMERRLSLSTSHSALCWCVELKPYRDRATRGWCTAGYGAVGIAVVGIAVGAPRVTEPSSRAMSARAR